MSRFSIVVTSYNQDFDKIRRSLDSILAQDAEDIEIVLADDGSVRNFQSELASYLDSKGHFEYKVVRNDHNVGTVKNVLSGLKVTTGQYGSLLSPGDFLADKTTVRDMLDFLKGNDISLASGVIKRYAVGAGEKIMFGDYHIGDPDLLEKGSAELLKQQLLYSNWASGGALFFDIEYFTEHLSILAERYNVIYCEDLVAPLITLMGGKLKAYDRQVLWYEWGVGISNSGGIENIRRMYNDYRVFYKGISGDYPDNRIIKAAYRKFRLKDGISRIPPLYIFIRNMLGCIGSDHLYSAEDTYNEQQGFLVDMLGL